MKRIALCLAVLLPILGWANEETLNNLQSDLTYNAIAQKFVNTNKLNVRAMPSSGDVVGQLMRGQSVFVYDRSGSWERISKENEAPKWVSSALLCSGVNCYSQKASTAISNNINNTRSSSTPRPTVNSYGTTCPCSGSTNCIGPRGGRYCYTSGGNKRYR